MPGYTATRLRGFGVTNEDLDRELLKRLNISKEDLTPRNIAKIWTRCAQDEEFFLFNFVRTKIESKGSRHSVQRMREDPYVREIIYAIHNDPKPILIDKTRRLTITWTMCGHAVWRTKFHRNRLVILQSKREREAWNLVFYKNWSNGRCSFIESNLPPWLRTEECEGVVGQLFYPTGSKIWGIPQGEHIIRGEGPTDFIMDECAFWPAFEESYNAGLALAADGCCVIALTTAYAGSPFAELIGVTEPEKENEESEDEEAYA